MTLAAATDLATPTAPVSRLAGDPPPSRSRADRPSAGAATTGVRPTVRGRFLYLGDHKLILRGVTYGPLVPALHGDEWTPELVRRDFTAMAELGINAVRLYTVPPRWLLDAAVTHGLLVLIGIPWEQHVAFLDDRGRARSIDRRVAAAVDACAGHPAVLAFAIGNEIPTEIVRWLGRRRVERFLARLCRTVKRRDPGALVTYVKLPADRIPAGAGSRLCRLQRVPRGTRALRRLSGPAAEPRRRPSPGHDRARPGRTAPRPGRAGTGAALAAARRVRLRCRRRVRVRVDRRVVPGRSRDHRLGLRPDHARASRQACRRRGRRRVRRARRHAASACPAHLGGDLHLQRSPNLGRLPGRRERARVSGLRGHRHR